LTRDSAEKSNSACTNTLKELLEELQPDMQGIVNKIQYKLRKQETK